MTSLPMPPYQNYMGVPQPGSQPNFNVNQQPMGQPTQTGYNAGFTQQPQMGGQQPGAGFNPMGPVYPQTYPQMGGLQQAQPQMGGQQPMVCPPQMGGQPPMGGQPQYTTYNVGPMGLPVTIDQSQMGVQPPMVQQPMGSQPPMTPSQADIQALYDRAMQGFPSQQPTTPLGVKPPQAQAPRPTGNMITHANLDQYNFDPSIKSYLQNTGKLNPTGDAGSYYYDPQSQTFTYQGGYGSKGELTNYSLADMQSEVNDYNNYMNNIRNMPNDSRTTMGQPNIAPNQTMFPLSVKPPQPTTVGTSPTIAPPKPAIAGPKPSAPPLNPNQINRKNMMDLEMATKGGAAALQKFLSQFPTTNLTSQQMDIQRKAKNRLDIQNLIDAANKQRRLQQEVRNRQNKIGNPLSVAPQLIR